MTGRRPGQEDRCTRQVRKPQAQKPSMVGNRFYARGGAAPQRVGRGGRPDPQGMCPCARLMEPHRSVGHHECTLVSQAKPTRRYVLTSQVDDCSGRQAGPAFSNLCVPKLGWHLSLAQLRAGSQAISARSRPHKVGPQEIESTPWVHTAGYLRARFVNSQAHKWGVLLAHQASSLSKFPAPAKSAGSKPGSHFAESTCGNPQFP